jgi:hypothetical protein
MSLWTDRYLSKSLTRAITTCDLHSAMFFLHTFCWYETGMTRVRKTKELSTNTTRCRVAVCVFIAVSTLHKGSWITTTHSFTTLSSLWKVIIMVCTVVYQDPMHRLQIFVISIIQGRSWERPANNYQLSPQKSYAIPVLKGKVLKLKVLKLKVNRIFWV